MKAALGLLAVVSANDKGTTVSAPELIESPHDDIKRPRVDECMHINRATATVLESEGVDISNLTVADEAVKTARGTLTASYANEWSVRDPVDNKIVIAWSVENGYPWTEKTIKIMERMSLDLGCLKTVYVPREELETTNWPHGLIFAHNNNQGGCWSALGQVSGYTGNTYWARIEDSGAPSGWQPIGMSSDCGGDTAATVMHEVLHALGVGHEHNRPDRDNYLNMFLGNSMAADQYYTISNANWFDTGHPFELESVMTYCSLCSSKNGQPVATLKDGSTFNDGHSMTTVDSLQIQYKYCKRDDESFQYKEHVKCGSSDHFGNDKEVFTDRLCDNVEDCPGGTDEGTIAPCIPAGEPTENGCCSIMTFNGVEFEFTGTHEGYDYWTKTAEFQSSHYENIVHYNGYSTHGDWFVTNMDMQVTLSTGSINFNSRNTLTADNSASKCPPSTGWTWLKPLCKYNGAQTEDFCANTSCHSNADCTNGFSAASCTCKEGFRGDGVSECEEIPIIDECAAETDNCDVDGGICTDEQYGFRCACDSGFVDKNEDEPGTKCEACCKQFTFTHKSHPTFFAGVVCTYDETQSTVSDALMFPCDNGQQLVHLPWDHMNNQWYRLVWTDNGRFTYYDKTVNHAQEGPCLSPEAQWEEYDVECTEYFGTGATAPPTEPPTDPPTTTTKSTTKSTTTTTTKSTTKSTTTTTTTKSTTTTPTTTKAPTEQPTETPTDAPTLPPTEAPTETPTDAPTETPTDAPTAAPTETPTEAPTQPLSFSLEISFPCKFAWNADYANPESDAYKTLIKDVMDWLRSILAPILDAYNMHLDVEINLRPPAGVRKRRDGDSTPILDIKVNLKGDVPADADTASVGAGVADEVGDACTEGVKNYDGEFLDETAVPTVSDPDIADKCDLRVSQQICAVDQQGISIPTCAFPADATPYLGNSVGCTGSLVGDNLVFVSETGPCHIDGVNNGTHISYVSSVNWEDGTANAIISRSRMIRVDFECVFATLFTLSLDNGLTPLLAKEEIDLGTAEGKVDINFGLWESRHFETPLADDAEISVPDELYVAAVLSDDSHFNAVLDSCWATPSFDPDDTNQYQFITDGCADPADDTLSIINQGESTSASFSIESFVFKAGESNEIFFHCQVTLCDPENETCTPECNAARKRRSTEESRHQVQMAVGPVKIV